MAELLPPIRVRYFDENGDPLSGGKLYSYEPGTVTPRATYADSEGLVPNTNPVILDANGEADVWITSGSYKFVLTDSADVVQWTKDNVPSIAGIISTEGALAVANNLSDLSDTSAALVNLGISTLPGDVSTLQGQMITAQADIVTAQTAANTAQSTADTHIANASGAHSASAISNTPSGNLLATTVQGALDELQTDIDTRSTSADLTAHTGNTSNPHGVTATQVGNTTAQWNADKLQGRAVASTAPTSGNALVWDGTNWAPAPMAASGSFSPATKTAAYTVTPSDDVILCDATSGAFTVTLPAASSNSGLRLKIKKIDSSLNAVTIDANAAETIDGNATALLISQHDFIEIVCDGAGWFSTSRLFQNRTQTKILSANVTSDGTVSDLTFNNLEVGKWYEVSGKVRVILDSGASDTNVSLRPTHNGSIIDMVDFTLSEAVDTASDAVNFAMSFKFKASATTLTFASLGASTSSFINGDGTRVRTYAQLTERNDIHPTEYTGW